MRVTPWFQSAHMITCSILLDGMTEEIFCSFVYGFNLAEERKELWKDLKAHQDSPFFQKSPWLVFGDFNEILSGVEHSEHTASHDSAGMREFLEVVN